MEQDIKKIEKFITIMKSDFRTGLYYKHELEAIEHLIKAYKELESKYDRALSDLVKAEHKNKELEEENEFLKLKERSRVLGRYGEIEVHDLINKTLANDYIPVSLVEEKIEEYTKLFKNCNRFSDVDRIKAINERILAYKELLEKRK